MNSFQQYYTNELYSSILVNNLIHTNPKSALDLGLGNGSLLTAAKNRWKDINLYGVDIDENNVNLAISGKSIKAILHDGFSPFLPDVLIEHYGNIDLLISNPPYFSKEFDSNIKKIFIEAGLNNCFSQSMKNVPAELVFLAQNLRLLNTSGEIGIILPAGLISGEKWKCLRAFLLDQYHVSCCVQLPPKSFSKTEAQAFILFIQSSKKVKSKVRLVNASNNEVLYIDVAKASDRMDFSFYALSQSYRGMNNRILTDDFEVFRGNTPHNKLKKMGLKDFVHTTQLKQFPYKANYNITSEFDCKFAIAGDILLARVGSRCLGRTCLVESGTVPISDCVMVIRATSKKSRDFLWKKLSRDGTSTDLKQLSLGVGAKYLTHKIVKDYLLNV